MRTLALLRGINVGGARTLPMAALERAFRAAGARSVETVIQSGNVVFAADDPGATAEAAADAVAAEFGFRPTMILRSALAWRAMVGANPFVAAGRDESHLHVACFAEPAAGANPPIDPNTVAPEDFVAAGADVYLYLPNGVGRAKLSNARLDRAFGGVSTMRNWRTALRLLERLEA